MSTVSLISPQGNLGEVPLDHVQAALSAGFKQPPSPPVPMTSPSGNAGMVPSERVKDALAAGFKINGNTIGAAPSFLDQTKQMLEHPLDALEAASQSVPMPKDASMGEMMENNLANVASGAAGVIRHPLKTAEGILSSGLGGRPLVENAEDAILQAAGKPARWNTPLVPNNPVDASRAIGSALALGGLGELGGAAASVLPDAAYKVGDAISKGSDAVENYLRPKPSPLIVSKQQMAARGLAQAVLPDLKDAPNFINAAAQEIPNILEYAKKTNNPLNTQLELAEAAKGHAQAITDFKNNQLMGELANKYVDTSGTGFGSQVGEGPRTQATLGDIDQRITAINKQLDMPKLNADDMRRALASKAELQAEASRLRDILHQSLSDARGITPEQVADVRQRAGRSWELANDIDAAATRRLLQQGVDQQAPQSIGKIPEQAVHSQIGGREGIADRAMQKALQPFRDMQASALPTLSTPPGVPPVAPRVSMAQAAGIQPGNPPSQVVQIDPASQLQAMRDAMTQRSASVQASRQAAQTDANLQAQRLEELLKEARHRQQVAASMRNAQ